MIPPFFASGVFCRIDKRTIRGRPIGSVPDIHALLLHAARERLAARGLLYELHEPQPRAHVLPLDVELIIGEHKVGRLQLDLARLIDVVVDAWRVDTLEATTRVASAAQAISTTAAAEFVWKLLQEQAVASDALNPLLPIKDRDERVHCLLSSGAFGGEALKSEAIQGYVFLRHRKVLQGDQQQANRLLETVVAATKRHLRKPAKRGRPRISIDDFALAQAQATAAAVQVDAARAKAQRTVAARERALRDVIRRYAPPRPQPEADRLVEEFLALEPKKIGDEVAALAYPTVAKRRIRARRNSQTGNTDSDFSVRTKKTK